MHGQFDYIPSCRLTPSELELIIQVPKDAGAAGVVVWGGGSDQGNRTLCDTFKTYFHNELGPAFLIGMHG
jgi:hypothetical protein